MGVERLVFFATVSIDHTCLHIPFPRDFVSELILIDWPAARIFMKQAQNLSKKWVAYRLHSVGKSQPALAHCTLSSAVTTTISTAKLF